MSLISIIIPTCNRYTYLQSVVETLLKVTSDTEIVISDNSDMPTLRDELKIQALSSRIVYQHHEQRLSVVENFERGLHMASGEYLLFIGDDDCVGPSIERIAQWAKSNQIDAVLSYRDRFLANYFWPGVKSKYFDDGYAAKMFVGTYTGFATPLNAKAAIRAAARRPGTGLGSMVRAYHGLIHRKFALDIARKYGGLFGGVSPDIYSAALISHEASNPYVLDYPFVIPGGSPPSTAGQGAARTDFGNLFSVDHIQRFGPELLWNAKIPAFYSPVTVWAYSLQCALNRIKDPDLEINYPRLYIRCLLQYWDFRSHIFASMRKWMAQGNRMGMVIGGATGALFDGWDQIKRVLNRLLRPHKQFASLQTIGEAYAQLDVLQKPPRLTTIDREI